VTTTRSAGPASSPLRFSSNGHHAPSPPALPTRQRPKGYAALAVVLIVGCSALGVWLYSQAGAKVPVVMAVHDIPAGHVIERADLTTVQVAGQVTAVGGNHLSSVVGQTAAVEILPNTLVQRAMVTAGSGLKPSEALVGVAVDPGQIPSAGLRAGDHVEVFGLPPKSSLGVANPSVLVASAVVFDVRDNPTTAGGSLLSLVVPRDAAAQVATAGSNNLIALVVVGG
jgi:hypothetical protein